MKRASTNRSRACFARFRSPRHARASREVEAVGADKARLSLPLAGAFSGQAKPGEGIGVQVLHVDEPFEKAPRDQLRLTGGSG